MRVDTFLFAKMKLIFFEDKVTFAPFFQPGRLFCQVPFEIWVGKVDFLCHCVVCWWEVKGVVQSVVMGADG